ncbi:Rha family transcriptional regulator [Pseudomonas sp. NPDC087358]|uniref:Rha family transcriptional regulator n=1 Tax=Pseudomonas sp. NPDC087358 TaxID=3364439 RepID=UPI00384E4134
MTDLILTEDDYRQLVQAHGGTPMTDSLKVANRFGKRHDNVLQAVDKLKCSQKFRLLNFQETITWRGNPKGGEPIKSRCVEITKDGFMFLVMGFTGTKAGAWKEAFIEAFNWLIEQLANRHMSWEQRRNEMQYVYKQKKGMASMAGKMMRNWQLEKPIIEGEMLAIEQDGQGVLQLH